MNQAPSGAIENNSNVQRGPCPPAVLQRRLLAGAGRGVQGCGQVVFVTQFPNPKSSQLKNQISVHYATPCIAAQHEYLRHNETEIQFD